MIVEAGRLFSRVKLQFKKLSLFVFFWGGSQGAARKDLHTKNKIEFRL